MRWSAQLKGILQYSRQLHNRLYLDLQLGKRVGTADKLTRKMSVITRHKCKSGDLLTAIRLVGQQGLLIGQLKRIKCTARVPAKSVHTCSSFFVDTT